MSGTVETPRVTCAGEALEISRLAGKPAPKEMLVDLARLARQRTIYKIYAESFQSHEHLNAIASEAKEIVNYALGET